MNWCCLGSFHFEDLQRGHLAGSPFALLIHSWSHWLQCRMSGDPELPQAGQASSYLLLVQEAPHAWHTASLRTGESHLEDPHLGQVFGRPPSVLHTLPQR